ncbi:MAG TPA: redox-sensing transcriptional repressor Rex [Clostridiales bacterium]|nr:redox-sensing transcriptional repressor Rex [Clostridiales bacterium]
MNNEIPVISLQRLPIYLNYLKSMPADRAYVSSGHIAEALGMGEVLVRKDLAYTSATGKPRVGYSVAELIAALEDFLCCNGCRNAVIAGAGALGRAVLGYGGFSNYGINVVAAFDTNPEKVGKEIAGKPVYDIADAEREIKKCNAELAVVCVPAQFAQEVADVLISCGIKAILNFAPVLIKAPEGVVVRHIDVAANLAILSSMI